MPQNRKQNVRLGGMGLRGAAAHAPAAYLASRTGTRRLCRQMDPDFVWELDQPGNALEAARVLYNSYVKDADKISSASLATDDAPLSQKKLSAKVDETVSDAILEGSCEFDRARLRAVAAPHASA